MSKRNLDGTLFVNPVALTAWRCGDPYDRRWGKLIPSTVGVIGRQFAYGADGWVVIHPPVWVSWGRISKIAREARRGDWSRWNAAAVGDWKMAVL